MILSVFICKHWILLSAGGTLSFRKLKERIVYTCGHNTIREREFLCCCSSKLKTNVLTDMLHFNPVNKESGDNQIWLKGNMGWGGYNLCLCVSLCVFHYSSRCSVVWWAWGLQQQTPLSLTSLLQLHLHPPSYQITRRASRCDMLLTSHLEPRFRKRDVWLLYHGWYTCTHAVTNSDT